MAEETIGGWTESRLVRFLEDSLRQNPPNRIPLLFCDDVTAATNVYVLDQITLNQFQTTVGTAGSASALPATPSGYFKIKDYTGAVRAVPFYNA